MARFSVLGLALVLIAGVPAAAAPPLVAGAVLISQPGTLEPEAAPGTAVLRVLASADGPVRDAALDLSSGDAAFDAAALDTVRRWRYVPVPTGKSSQPAWLLVRLISRPTTRLARLSAR